jgi:hypothetical protein
MTLHLTLATAQYVLQVSDRLTSLDPGKRPWDPLANKNVVYAARDGLISIGYTGVAYIRGLPTDTWIAQTLRGDSLAPEGGRHATVSRDPPNFLDVGQAVRLLQAELEQYFQTLRSRNANRFLWLTISGWQWKNRRLRPVSWLLINGPATPEVYARKAQDRYWGWERGDFYIQALPPILSDDGKVRLAGLLGPMINQPMECEKTLVGVIRSFADNNPATIGRNCMSVLMPRPDLAPTYIRYHPLRAFTINLPQEQSIPAAFCPWVLAGRVAHAPSVILSTGVIEGGRCIIVLESPPRPPSSVLVGVYSQPRKPPPGQPRWR